MSLNQAEAKADLLAYLTDVFGQDVLGEEPAAPGPFYEGSRDETLSHYANFDPMMEPISSPSMTASSFTNYTYDEMA